MELKAQDLRVGNWVIENEFPNIYSKIQSISFTGYASSSYNDSINVKDLTPIPITEDILLKFGFEKTDDFGDQIYYALINRGNRHYYICFDHDDISFGLSVFNQCTSLIYDSDSLQNLHQLQNLYFALTKKELEITL
jgi:hypothetical protein